MLKRAAVESTAEAYLELLAARGVEYLFANAGTDFAPLIEAYAKRGAQGQAAPRPITVPHEIPAVAMAHGYAMVTGRAQAVMVHVIVGAGNAVGGIINAARANVPMLFSAGRNPISEAGHSGSRDRPIHWAQESFDQAAMVREFVKWDYELRSASHLETVVDRALTLAHAEPLANVTKKAEFAPRDGRQAETPRGTAAIRGIVVAADNGTPVRRAQIRASAPGAGVNPGSSACP